MVENIPQKQKEECYSYMNGKKVAQRPFDTLKQLWDDWNIWLDSTPSEQWKSFEEWYGHGDNPNETHLSLAKHCGFATAGEVRRILQHFKNNN